MAWSDVWKDVRHWPAAFAAGFREIWPELRLAIAGVVGAMAEQLRQERNAAVRRQRAADDFAAHQRSIRVDPGSRERLRRESGKPSDDK